MENKSRIDSILSDINELEQLLVSVRNAKIYPVVFFSRSFDLAHHLLKDLHLLEGEQIESLHRQMEQYRRMIDSVSLNSEVNDNMLQNDINIVASIAEIPETHETPETHEIHGTVNDNRQTKTLNDIINSKNLSDLRKAFSLNDRFYFQKELFGGDEAKMNSAITELNTMDSYEKSLAYIHGQLKWDESNDIVKEFLGLIKKRFS